VALDPAGPRLVDEQIGERVRKVARQRDQPVMALRVDRDRHGTERGDEPVDEPVALRVGRRDRRQEPGRAVEEIRARMRRAVRLAPADRMPSDELLRQAQRPFLRRADVGDRAAVGRARDHLLDEGRQDGDGCGDDGEVGLGEQVAERPDLVDRSALQRHSGRVLVGVVSADPVHAGALRRQTYRGPDQAGTYERETHQRARISSATWNARSSDCRAFRRGSQRVV
jgi:hypothetical protein